MLLDGKVLADKILSEIKVNKKYKLVIIYIGDNYASSIYTMRKKKVCEKLGIDCEILRYSFSIKEGEIVEKIKELNLNKKVTGIMVQLPIPKDLDTFKIINTIDPSKDVDGLTAYNQGLLLQGQKPYYYPCTPLGILTLLKYYKIPLQGKKVVIVGRSNIVGKPLAVMLTRENATVTLCHSKTKKLKEITKKADILISAIGKVKYFNKRNLKENSVVIDVGINRNKDGKIVGDVNFERVKDIVKYIAPVPGGVGPLTIASLMKNIVS